MKKLFFIAVSVFAFQFSNAQEEAPIKKNQFNFKTASLLNEDNWTKHDYTLEYERKINSDLSYGASFNFYQTKNYLMAEKINDTYTNHFSKNDKSYGLSLNVKYDWSRLIGLNTEKVDLFTGTSVGASISDYYFTDITETEGITSMTSRSMTSNNYFIGASIGARYWIAKNIGISAELDRGFYATNKNLTKLNLGLNYRF